MKKGFTLIELLAVIVILAIIALIATPIILNIINDTRSEARVSSAEAVAHAVETAYLTSMMKEEANGAQANFTNNDVIRNTKIDNERSRVVDIENIDPSIETNDGVTCTLSTAYELTCTYGGENVIEPKSINHNPPVQVCELSKEYTSKKVGSQYTCHLDIDRIFYVLEDGDDTTLTKGTTGTAGTGEMSLIMDENYIDAKVPVTMKWCASGNNNSCKHDNLDQYIAHIQGVFRSNVTVSLPTYDQIYAINNNIYFGTKTWLYGNLDTDSSTKSVPFAYWTSTPHSSQNTNAWYATANGNLNHYKVNDASSLGNGVRPVITISKDSLN